MSSSIYSCSHQMSEGIRIFYEINRQLLKPARLRIHSSSCVHVLARTRAAGMATIFELDGRMQPKAVQSVYAGFDRGYSKQINMFSAKENEHRPICQPSFRRLVFSLSHLEIH